MCLGPASPEHSDKGSYCRTPREILRIKPTLCMKEPSRYSITCVSTTRFVRRSYLLDAKKTSEPYFCTKTMMLGQPDRELQPNDFDKVIVNACHLRSPFVSYAS
ncbi:hypothetical protein TNCV_4883771 [Trichonephila clavipes]|nr:hypothetical protein TNCV_4883771 [Trichonephila clavipes]